MSRIAEVNIVIECALGQEYFEDWNDLSPIVQAFWDEETRQPNCEGSGQMGTICEHCPFCNSFDEEQI